MKPRNLIALRRRVDAYEALAERSLEIMAKAMQLAFEGGCDLLSTVRDEVEARRYSGNRMRYIFANVAAVVLILLIWLGIRTWGSPEPGVLSALFSGELASTEALPLSHLDVLVFGALGAFFSVSIGLKAVHVNHSIALSEMLYAGIVRVAIGVIAAMVVILLISGGWLLGAVDAEYRPWAFYLFGFLAGFSEFFVPNALKQVEASARVERHTPSPPGPRLVPDGETR